MITALILIAINCYIGFITFMIGRQREEIPNTYFHLIGITVLGVGSLLLMILSKLEAKYEPTPIESKKDYISIAFIYITGIVILTLVTIIAVNLIKADVHVSIKVTAAVITGFISSFTTKHLIDWLNRIK